MLANTKKLVKLEESINDGLNKVQAQDATVKELKTLFKIAQQMEEMNTKKYKSIKTYMQAFEKLETQFNTQNNMFVQNHPEIMYTTENEITDAIATIVISFL